MLSSRSIHAFSIADETAYMPLNQLTPAAIPKQTRSYKAIFDQMANIPIRTSSKDDNEIIGLAYKQRTSILDEKLRILRQYSRTRFDNIECIALQEKISSVSDLLSSINFLQNKMPKNTIYYLELLEHADDFLAFAITKPAEQVLLNNLNPANSIDLSRNNFLRSLEKIDGLHEMSHPKKFRKLSTLFQPNLDALTHINNLILPKIPDTNPLSFRNSLNKLIMSYNENLNELLNITFNFHYATMKQKLTLLKQQEAIALNLISKQQFKNIIKQIETFIDETQGHVSLSGIDKPLYIKLLQAADAMLSVPYSPSLVQTRLINPAAQNDMGFTSFQACLAKLDEKYTRNRSKNYGSQSALIILIAACLLAYTAFAIFASITFPASAGQLCFHQIVGLASAMTGCKMLIYGVNGMMLSKPSTAKTPGLFQAAITAKTVENKNVIEEINQKARASQ